MTGGEEDPQKTTIHCLWVYELPGVDWCGKRVVIAGMGAFAVENVSKTWETRRHNLCNGL